MAAARTRNGSPGDELDRPLQFEKGVGPRRAELLARLALRTARDVLLHLPRRYEDRTRLGAIADLVPGEEATVRARIVRVRASRPRRGPVIVTARLEDDTGTVDAVWFNRKYLVDLLREGAWVVVTGKPRLYREKLQIAPSEYELVPAPDEGDTLFDADIDGDTLRASRGPSARGDATGRGGSTGRGRPQGVPAEHGCNDGFRGHLAADDGAGTGDAAARPQAADELAAPARCPREETRSAPPGSPADLAAGRIVPFYPLTEGVSQRLMRGLAWGAVTRAADAFPDILPGTLRDSRGLMPLGEAFREVHFPSSMEKRDEARRRLVYEELFVLQAGLALVRARSKAEIARVFSVTDEIDGRIRARFPFALTSAQDRAAKEIARDLESGQPMNRLLQGDVGSGKTAVATYAMLAVVANGGQAVVMAPTELLAAQHARTLSRFLEGSRVVIALVKGGQDAAERREALSDIASGRAHIAVGTHALIEESVKFRDLGLVVMDEQHKFGVAQRGRLRRKGASPHVLVMTATPIPRTLALAYFGDLDLSVIDELPPGRGEVATKVVKERERTKAYARVKEIVRSGRQAYVVCPRVEGGDMQGGDERGHDRAEGAFLSPETVSGVRGTRTDSAYGAPVTRNGEHVPPPGEIRAATQTRDRLARGTLKGLTVGLLHGRMPTEEKADVMRSFVEGKTQVLVCTVVIEVGIDVPNATALVVEHAERFGLAQLHQLRGRISRGSHPGECFLIADPKTEGAVERLAALEETNDGFKISEADYRIRGPGEFFGTRQSGLPELRFADILADTEILKEAREDAFRTVAESGWLSGEEWTPLRRRVSDVFAGRLELGGVG